MNLRKTMTKQLKSRKGFTLLEVMVCATILVIATTASLQIYLQTAYLVEDAKEKTVAMTHNKIVMEEIRSWQVLSDDAINSKDWQTWLSDRVSQALLPEELVIVHSEDWVNGFSTSPRRVVVKTTWKGVKRAGEMILVGGFI